MNTETFTLSRTATVNAILNGWCLNDVRDAFNNPKKVYESKQRPGQWRVVNRDICLVGIPDGSVFRVLTMFPNGSQAPHRKVAA